MKPPRIITHKGKLMTAPVCPKCKKDDETYRDHPVRQFDGAYCCRCDGGFHETPQELWAAHEPQRLKDRLEELQEWKRKGMAS